MMSPQAVIASMFIITIVFMEGCSTVKPEPIVRAKKVQKDARAVGAMRLDPRHGRLSALFAALPSTPVLLYCTTTLHNHSSGASIAPTLGYLSTHFRLPPYPSATRTTRSQGSVMSCKLSAVSLS